MKEKIKINIKNLIAIAMTVIFTVVLFILSNTTKAAELDDVSTTYGLGKVAIEFENNDYEFLRTDVGNLFKFNYLYHSYLDSYGLEIRDDKSDIYWNSVICLWHAQSTTKGAGGYHEVQNIIDIETPRVERKTDGNIKETPTITATPGIVTVYKFSDEGNKGKYSENVTLDDKKITVSYDKVEKNLNEFKLDGRSAKTDFKYITYFIYKSINKDTQYTDTQSNTKAAISGYWSYYIKDYIKQTELLYPYFDIDKDDVGTTDPKYLTNEINSATTETAKILETIISKENTVPEVQYVEADDKTYIGPLKVKYAGGTTSLVVKYTDKNGTEQSTTAKWVTKDKDTEKFSEEQNGNITSGQVFYAVVTGKVAEPVTVEATQNYDIYQARIAIAAKKQQHAQQLMFYSAKKDSDSSTVTWEIYNQPKYGSLTIYKKGEDETKLEGVEFSIWKAQTTDTGYLRLIKNSKFVSEVSEEIDLNDYTVEYVGIKELSKATKFVTDSDGKIVIQNLEYTTGSINYNYYLKEELNNKYGYKCICLSKEDITVDGVTVEDVRTNGNIKFALSESEESKEKDETVEVVFTINNTPNLAPLEVLKVNDQGKPIAGVKLKIEIGEGKYLQLKDAAGKNSPLTGEVTINKNNIAGNSEYSVKYVSNKNDATEFITNDKGKVIINNLEIYNSSEKYLYTAHEIENPNYGYGSSNGAEIKKEKNLTLGRTTTVTLDNSLEVGHVQITKCDKDNESIKLENVEFKIKVTSGTSYTRYIALYDENGKRVKDVQGTATINLNNTAQAQPKQYRVSYVQNISDATIFKTDSYGKITINNLEINKSSTETYNYTACEIKNPNYGYGSKENNIEKEIELTSNETKKITIKNEKELGNIRVGTENIPYKYDADYPNIKLSDVEFIIRISSDADSTNSIDSTNNGYLALYDENDEIVPKVNGTVTINSKNEAKTTTTGKQYKVKYYSSTKEYSEMTAKEKAQLTIFATDEDGKMKVENLEKYQRYTGELYKYDLLEIYNPHYGYDSSFKVEDIEIEKGKTADNDVTNIQKWIKISGYVWIDNKEDIKDSVYDGVYTNTKSSKDIKLTDLYIVDQNGKVTGIDNGAKIPVEIKLYNTSTKEFVRTQPDEFDRTTGKYTFIDVVLEKEMENLKNYEVVFIYDGFYYTTVIESLDEENGSKVKEVEQERTNLNNMFGAVKSNSEVISVDNKVNTATYNKDGHTSTLSGLSFNTKISANTTIAGYNLYERLDTLKKAVTTPVQGLDNINMGLVLREQPKLALGNDIYSVIVDVNNKSYDYYYNGRQNYYDNLNNDEVGVKFEQEEAKNRYTRPIYSSDVKAYKNGLTNMEVSLIYKIQIINQNDTLTSVVHEIANYFDGAYTIEEIGLSINDKNEIGDKLSATIFDASKINKNVHVEYGNGVTPETGKTYSSINISLSEKGKDGLTLEEGQSKYIYIKYKVDNVAIEGLLSGKSTYHNAVEIMKYSTYYGDKTGKQEINNKYEYFATEQRNAGQVYAGIDRSSQPGNIELKLIKDSRDGEQESTPILDTSNYEDDTSSAPALILEPVEPRKISGIIFEDTATQASLANNEKLGDGIYNATNEKGIANVKVELYDVKTGQIAKLSNGELADTMTDPKGQYTFGDDTKGVIPGDYIIKYTYNNESYIVDSRGNKIKNLNVNDYKSTIITSEIIEKAIKDRVNTITFEGTNYPIDKWYIIQEANRYSDAIDDIELRESLESENVKYSTYQNASEATYIMEATTPVMNIGIEFTATDEMQVDTSTLQAMRSVNEKIDNVDFGIIERPDVNIEIEKEITGLEITSQTGTNIISKGDPSNPNASMQYVKTGLDGLVSAEIESTLLQGATLNLEYSITATNRSQIDYKEEEYYIYGRNGRTIRISRVQTVVDYLDATMTLDTEKNEDVWKTGTTAQQLYDDGFISSEVKDVLKNEEYHILLTEQFYDLDGINEEKTIKLYANKYLATSSNIEESNSVEILELTGRKTIKSSIPGNYNPRTDLPNEPDDDTVELIIVPPTGTSINYIAYIIAAVTTFAILVSGILIIKKKIIR